LPHLDGFATLAMTSLTEKLLTRQSRMVTVASVSVMPCLFGDDVIERVVVEK
jgi:hypothetical protein